MTTTMHRWTQLARRAARALPILALVGCGHETPPGSVLMKVDEQTLHVRIEDAGVRPGDRLALYDSRCESRSGTQKRHRVVCRTEQAGTAVVVDALNDRDFVVHVDPETRAREGQLVKKESGR